MTTLTVFNFINEDDEQYVEILQLPLSDEQRAVVEQVKDNNVICDSVAGSGKTTTILNIAKAYPNWKICMLTYNARLKFETRDKAALYNLTNIEVNSYHSFCCSHYYTGISDDVKLRSMLLKNAEPRKSLNYDLIIIDEVQDMTPIYFELVCKIVYDINKATKFVITGDSHQSIYSFNLADERYLIHADKIFKFNSLPWVRTDLSISYRITKPIANFMNMCVLNENRMRSVKESEYKPRYLICNSYIEPFKFSKKDQQPDLTLLEEVKYYLRLGYKPGDFFIIAPSVKPKSPVRALVSRLKTYDKGIEVYIPTSDNKKIDEDAIKDKMTFISFHQSKGLERKVCIVYGIDSGYFEIFDNKTIDSVCPNEIYVALTRALERLSVVHHNTKNFAPFMNVSNIKRCCEMIGDTKKEFKNCVSKREMTISELTDYTPELLITNCKNKYKTKTISESRAKIIIPDVQRRLSDEVIRFAIYHYYLYTKFNDKSIIVALNEIVSAEPRFSKTHQDYIEYGIIDIIDAMMEAKTISFSDFLRMCHAYYCCKDNIISQFDSFTYFNIDCKDIFAKFDKVFNGQTKFATTDHNNDMNCFNCVFTKPKFPLQKIINSFDVNSLNEKVVKPTDEINELLKQIEMKQERKSASIVKRKAKNSDEINALKKKVEELMKVEEDKINVVKTLDEKISKIDKVFFNDKESVLKIELSGRVDIYNNGSLFIATGDEITTSDVINAIINHYVFSEMYKLKSSNITVYNPFAGKRMTIEVNKNDSKYMYELLLLNRFIGFKQLTTHLFVDNALAKVSEYFE